MKRFFATFVLIVVFNLYFPTKAIDLPKYYKFPKNYLKGKFYNSTKDFFIVATDRMNDSRFKNTVIIMLDHDEKGAMGIVINKPLGEISLSSLINKSKNLTIKKKELINVNITIYWGGPLDRNKILILHSNDYKNKTTKNYKNISISTDYKALVAIAEKKGPKKSLVILGVSAWSNGQLEGEIEMGHWNLSEMNEDIIFEKDNFKKIIKATKDSFMRL